MDYTSVGVICPENERKEFYARNRHEYYIKNKQIINQRARERYAKKKEDPEYYKTLLLKNQTSYHKKSTKKVPELSIDQEEEFFKKIVKDVRAGYRENECELKYDTIHELFFQS
jgi:hypothetical protein